MPAFLMAPAALVDAARQEDVELAVEDRCDDHGSDDGEGVWIRSFMRTLIQLVVSEFPTFTDLDSSDDICDRTMEMISSPMVRRRVVDFINAEYEAWRDRHVEVYS